MFDNYTLETSARCLRFIPKKTSLSRYSNALPIKSVVLVRYYYVGRSIFTRAIILAYLLETSRCAPTLTLSSDGILCFPDTRVPGQRENVNIYTQQLKTHACKWNFFPPKRFADNSSRRVGTFSAFSVARRFSFAKRRCTRHFCYRPRDRSSSAFFSGRYFLFCYETIRRAFCLFSRFKVKFTFSVVSGNATSDSSRVYP